MLLEAIILAASVWINGALCYSSDTDCVVQVGEQPLPADSSIMEPIWNYKGVTWAGNPWCYELGLFPTATVGFDQDGNPVDMSQVGACRVLASTPPAPLVCRIGQEAFVGCYSSNGTLLAVRDDGVINFNWGSGQPDPAVPSDGFDVVWEGDFTLPAGMYAWSATADDGVRLSVDGVVVIDAWYDQAPTTYTATTILATGVHRIRMEYYENGGGAVAQLDWQISINVPAAPSALQVN